VLIVFFTAILAWVAYHTLNSLSQTARSDFLLKIDERYTSADMLKARTIIHTLYCNTRGENICEKTRISKISEEIKVLYASNKDRDAEEFMLLLNFLDLLETIAFFSNKKRIDKDEVNELSGASIVYYYDVFKPWIFDHRIKKNNDDYYCELQKLAKEFNEMKNVSTS